MISLHEVEECLEAYIETRAFDEQRLRVARAVVRSISPEVHRLIRNQVLEARLIALRERDSGR